MKKDLIDTIMEKEFNELTPLEQAELREFCATEFEYNQMKDVFVGVEAMQFKTPTPRAETKQRLDDLFDQTYPKASPVWYASMFAVVAPKEKPLYRQPLMQVAAVGLLFFLLYPFWTTEVAVPNENKVTVASNDITQDQSAVNANSEGTVTSSAQEVKNEEPIVERSEVPVRLALNTPGEISSIAIEVAPAAVSTPNDHPDGVFVAFSLPASETPELLDLLTTTF